MKSKNIIVKIEEPCSQDWNSMIPQKTGRFCNRCTKIVTDFTNYTDEQIIEFLKKNKGEVCGRVRMRKYQLKNYQFAYKNPTVFNNVVFRYSLAGILAFTSQKGLSQGNIKFDPVVQIVKDNAGKNHSVAGINQFPDKNADGKTSITFRVTDKFTGKSLTKASIYLSQTGRTFKPADAATFIIEIPDSLKNKNLTFYISSPSHETESRTINPKENGVKLISIMLTKETSVIMGKMVYIPEDTASKKKCTK